MTKKNQEKNDSALMSSIESGIIEQEEADRDKESNLHSDSSPMSYVLKREFNRIPHTKIPSSGKRLVVACASTGGPNAFQKIIPVLPANLNAPVILVQHMAKGFTGSLAKRLGEKSFIEVKEAAAGEKLKNGCVYVAKAGEHITVEHHRGGLYISFSDIPARSGLKPCADILFESLMDKDVDEFICVVLTGMGSDGTRGIGHLSEKKNVYCIAQDEETSTVYGMPGMVVKAGLADEVLPLESIADAIIRVTGTK